MGKHMTLQDRETIEIQIKRGSTQKEIAQVLKRSASSISREISNNSIKKKGSNQYKYLALEAHHKAYVRRWRAKTQSMKISMNTELRFYITSELQRKDIITSPKSIAFEWNSKTEDTSKHITYESIYKWLEQPANDKYRKELLYKKGYKKVKAIKGSKIVGRIGLEERPTEANDRKEKGHFEADLIVSNKGNKSVLLTLIDRYSRLPQIFKLPSKGSKSIMDLIASIKDTVGIKTITFDNGLEFSFHQLLKGIGIETYFCKPYHSWEKGSIENLNRIIRRYYPKGTNFDTITKSEVKRVCNIIADSPREILGFKTPNQVHFE